MASIQLAYDWLVAQCNAPNVGYSQQYRNAQVVGGVTYYDCSSILWYALINGGFDCVAANGGNTWPFTTDTMGPVLLRLGLSQYGSCGMQWEPGDIVLTTGHCEMVYSDGAVGSGRTMGAHAATDEHGDPIPLADQVSIDGINGCGDFPTLFRVGGAAGLAHKPMPLWLYLWP